MNISESVITMNIYSTTEFPSSSESGEYEEKTNVKGLKDTYYIYLVVSLVLVLILVCLKGCLVYSAKKKLHRDSG